MSEAGPNEKKGAGAQLEIRRSSEEQSSTACRSHNAHLVDFERHTVRSDRLETAGCVLDEACRRLGDDSQTTCGNCGPDSTFLAESMRGGLITSSPSVAVPTPPPRSCWEDLHFGDCARLVGSSYGKVARI